MAFLKNFLNGELMKKILLLLITLCTVSIQAMQDLDKPNNTGYTKLMRAAYTDNVTLINRLAEHGATVDLEIKDHSALTLAIDNDNERAVQALLNNKATISQNAINRARKKANHVILNLLKVDSQLPKRQRRRQLFIRFVPYKRDSRTCYVGGQLIKGNCYCGEEIHTSKCNDQFLAYLIHTVE